MAEVPRWIGHIEVHTYSNLLHILAATVVVHVGPEKLFCSKIVAPRNLLDTGSSLVLSGTNAPIWLDYEWNYLFDNGLHNEFEKFLESKQTQIPEARRWKDNCKHVAWEVPLWFSLVPQIRIYPIRALWILLGDKLTFVATNDLFLPWGTNSDSY